jgi:hypothetical protein
MSPHPGEKRIVDARNWPVNGCGYPKASSGRGRTRRCRFPSTFAAGRRYGVQVGIFLFGGLRVVSARYTGPAGMPAPSSATMAMFRPDGLGPETAGAASTIIPSATSSVRVAANSSLWTRHLQHRSRDDPLRWPALCRSRGRRHRRPKPVPGVPVDHALLGGPGSASARCMLSTTSLCAPIAFKAASAPSETPAPPRSSSFSKR